MSILTRSSLGFLFAILVIGCTEEQVATEERVELATSHEVAMSIEAAQERLTAKLISMPGVAGTGIGECGGRPCIKIFLEKKTPDLMVEIPSNYEGFPVVVEETGEIQAQD